MSILNRLKFRSKLILLLVFPLSGMFYFSTLGILDKNDLLEESYRIEKLSEFAITGSALVHELQKERGATSGFLGSEGRKFSTELPEQRARTDERFQDLNTFLRGFEDEAYGSELHSILVQILKDGEKIDSIRQSAQRMVEVLKYKAEILESIAGGDLTVNIKKASDIDGLGNSLVIMKESLNTLLSGVNESVIQVTSGVDQISQVSQSLAQGATEQAATLEEISAASLEIKSQATLNADNSQKAYTLARQSNQEADSGNIKMSELLSSMNSIRGSSDEINKIVKFKVADFLQKISEGSTEQEKGINEIVKGLDQIDQVTQANAAQSEETASASEEISSQGQELRNLIAAFKLEKRISNVPELNEGNHPEYNRKNRPVLKALPSGNEVDQS